MMKDIFILNKGIVDTDAFHLLGASTKRDDETKIGYFGSGLKYALAWMLRNGINFKVYADKKEIKFGLKKKDFRGKQFSVITINGKDTSITTEMGPDWNGWFALREMICNALDEEGGIYGFTETEMQPQEGMTFFLIKGNELFSDFIDNAGNYLSSRRYDKLCDSKGREDGKLFPSIGEEKSLIIYRKGIQALYEKNRQAIFNYDFENIDINESRVIKDAWLMRYKAFDLINGADIQTKRLFIERLNSKMFEWNMAEYTNNNIEENWLQAMEGFIIIPTWTPTAFLKDVDIAIVKVLPDWLYEAFENRFGNKLPKLRGSSKDKIILEMDEYQKKIVLSAKEVFVKLGMEIKYEIVLAEFRTKSQMGEAADNKIYVSPHCIEKGVFETCAVMLEEELHLESSYGDNTREFQNYIFVRLLREMIKSKNIII